MNRIPCYEFTSNNLAVRIYVSSTKIPSAQSSNLQQFGVCARQRSELCKLFAADACSKAGHTPDYLQLPIDNSFGSPSLLYACPEEEDENEEKRAEI
jgi:hypothetical protein